MYQGKGWGINMTRWIDLTGQQFGELTVIDLSDKTAKNGTRLWQCLCRCGKTIYVLGSSLRAGHYKSCGCTRAKKRYDGILKHLESDQVDGTRRSSLKAKLHKGNKSGYKGVMWLENSKRWKASIGFKGKQIALGHFRYKEDAIEARKKAEELYHKPYIEAYEEKNR